MTAIGDALYIYGGQEPSTGLCFSDIAKLDTLSWTWSVINPSSGKPPARHAHCAGVLEGTCLLVYGGASQQSTCALLWE
jgi:hypothetical protein